MSTDVGALIAHARDQAGLSPTDLAKILNVAQSTVSRWESNGARPTKEHPQRLIEVLGLDPDEFYRALGTTPAPTGTADVEDAIRADRQLNGAEKWQLLSLYRHFGSTGGQSGMAQDDVDRATRELEAAVAQAESDASTTASRRA